MHQSVADTALELPDSRTAIIAKSLGCPDISTVIGYLAQVLRSNLQ